MKGTLAITFISILCLSMFSAFMPKVTAQQSSNDWPMFRADPSHDGVGTGNPALTPTLLWKYPICNNNSGIDDVSSPSVVNGVVYIGSYDGNVYALGGSPTSSLSPSPTLTAVPSSTVPEFPAQVLIITLVVSAIVVLSVVLNAKKRIT